MKKTYIQPATAIDETMLYSMLLVNSITGKVSDDEYNDEGGVKEFLWSTEDYDKEMRRYGLW